MKFVKFKYNCELIPEDDSNFEIFLSWFNLQISTIEDYNIVKLDDQFWYYGERIKWEDSL